MIDVVLIFPFVCTFFTFIFQNKTFLLHLAARLDTKRWKSRDFETMGKQKKIDLLFCRRKAANKLHVSRSTAKSCFLLHPRRFVNYSDWFSCQVIPYVSLVTDRLDYRIFYIFFVLIMFGLFSSLEFSLGKSVNRLFRSIVCLPNDKNHSLVRSYSDFRSDPDEIVIYRE